MQLKWGHLSVLIFLNLKLIVGAVTSIIGVVDIDDDLLFSSSTDFTVKESL